ncbi:MAG: hypothetical protein IJD12_06410, partial [Tidjanibacter sp.]|nr:hypothetical protein [Tidjanibacter sp.]
EKINQKESEILECQAYLDSTDWQLIAQMERQREIPEEVRAKRIEAVERINTLQGEVAELREQLAKEQEVERLNIEHYAEH